MDEERFDSIVAIILANLVDEFGNLDRSLNKNGVYMPDVSAYCGFGGTLLSGANVNSHELKEFNQKFSTLYKVEGGCPALQKCSAEIAARENALKKRHDALAKLSLEDRQALGLL